MLAFRLDRQLGRCFTKRDKRPHWSCARRGPPTNCLAQAQGEEEGMLHNTSPHVEKCKVYNIEHVKMTALVKEGALQNKYLPTRAITEKVMNDAFKSARDLDLKKPDTLIRSRNRVRA